MDEPKDNPKACKRSRRKPAMEPLGWEEIISQPGMGGYLSFLNGPVPLPHLQQAAPGMATDPGVATTPVPDAVVPSHDRESAVATTPEVMATSEVITTPAIVATPDINRVAGLAITPEVVAAPAKATTPATFSTPVAVSATVSPLHRQRRIRKCAAAQDGHSLGEEILYQALWKVSAPDSAGARTIVIGWRGMSQLCRMTPKNCKINTQRLIRKLALEVLSPYNTPESIGTTYRIYSEAAIFQRRREAGLEWVVRSRGVEFVDPATGSLLPTCADT